MNASIGFVDVVTPAGTAGFVTGWRDQSLAALLANCSFTVSAGAWAKHAQLSGRSITAGAKTRIPTPLRALPISALLDNRSHHHLEQPAHPNVTADRTIMELVVSERLPVVARAVGFVAQGKTGKLRIQLSVRGRHLVHYQIQGRDNVDTRPARARFEIRIARRAENMTIRIHFKQQTHRRMRVVRRRLATQGHVAG